MLTSAFDPKRTSRQVVNDDSHRSVLRRFPDDLRRAGAVSAGRMGGNASHPSRMGAGDQVGRGAIRDLTASESADQSISMMVFMFLFHPWMSLRAKVAAARGDRRTCGFDDCGS